MGSTSFSYRRNDRSPLGLIGTRGYRAGRGGKGPPRLHTIRGILMHGSLAVTTAGLPLGLAAVKFWTRKKFRHTNALRGKICATRVPIEARESVGWLENLRQTTATLARPRRLVHIGDRESDICELFCATAKEVTNFMEDRELPQDPEIQLPRRGIATANGPPARQPSDHPQHPFVARLLADMLGRTAPEAVAGAAFTPLQQRLLNAAVPRAQPSTALHHCLSQLARLCGSLARAHDSPPDNLVVWRGLARLNDLVLGAKFGFTLVGK